MADSPAVPRLALRGITKRYPGVLANDRVDLDVLPARSTPSSERTARASRR
jgi:ABC-type uncharacterized transport systems, ATPase components